MARIISGFQTQGGDYDNMAVLKGYKSGREARLSEEQNRRANEGLELERMRLQMTIQQALREQMQEESVRQEQAKAGRLQQFTQKAQAGSVNPGQKMVERIIGARGRLKDPKALAMFDDSVSSLLKAQQQAKKRKAFDETMRMAEMDADVFPPEMIQSARQEAAAGGDIDSIVKRFGEYRVTHATTQQVVGENEEAQAKAAEVVRLAEPGYGKKRAQIILNAYANSKALKEKEGSGAALLKAVQNEALGTRTEFNAKDPNAAPAPGLQGMTVGQRNEELMKEPFLGFGGPDIPQFIPRGPQAHATVRGAQDRPHFIERPNKGLGQVVTQAVGGGARGPELVKLLRDQGVNLDDPEVVAQVEAALRGGG